MSHLDDLSTVNNYQFPRWSSSISRPHSSLPSKDAVNDMFQLGIDNRHQLEKPDSSSSSRRIIRHHVRIPSTTRLESPPILNQPSPTPDVPSTFDHPSTASMGSRLYRSAPVRLKSTAFTIPIASTKHETSYQNFPKQTHEKRKITHERKRRKQQAQTLAEKYAETETWFQLRRSLAELKRLATTQEILVDPTTSLFNCDGHSFTALKQVMAEQQEEKIPAMFNSESGPSSSVGSTPSRDFTRASITTSQNSFANSRMTKRSTETYPRLRFESLLVESKPIHPLLLSANHHPRIKPTIKYTKPPASAPPRSRVHPVIPLSDERRTQLLLSDLSNEDNFPVSSTPSPPLVKIEQEVPSRKIVTPSSTLIRAPSSIQLTSTMKLKSQPPRCRSATDIKSSYPTTKQSPRFILIADQEHRIESWYHQYPFILSDDLLTSFESKQKSTISAYFIDDSQSSNPNITAKIFLQGKPFHINNDWKKYDLIFISNHIYQKVIIYLQTIINLIKSSGKLIQIYQINHDEDLKKQVKNICKQLQQQNL